MNYSFRHFSTWQRQKLLLWFTVIILHSIYIWFVNIHQLFKDFSVTWAYCKNKVFITDYFFWGNVIHIWIGLKSSLWSKYRIAEWPEPIITGYSRLYPVISGYIRLYPVINVYNRIYWQNVPNYSFFFCIFSGIKIARAFH